MDEIHIDTQRLRALPTRYTWPDGTVMEQLSDGTFKQVDLAGNLVTYFKAEAVDYKGTLEEEYWQYRARANADADRILDQGIDRTPQRI